MVHLRAHVRPEASVLHTRATRTSLPRAVSTDGTEGSLPREGTVYVRRTRTSFGRAVCTAYRGALGHAVLGDIQRTVARQVEGQLARLAEMGFAPSEAQPFCDGVTTVEALIEAIVEAREEGSGRGGAATVSKARVVL